MDKKQPVWCWMCFKPHKHKLSKSQAEKRHRWVSTCVFTDKYFICPSKSSLIDSSRRFRGRWTRWSDRCRIVVHSEPAASSGKGGFSFLILTLLTRVLFPPLLTPSLKLVASRSPPRGSCRRRSNIHHARPGSGAFSISNPRTPSWKERPIPAERGMGRGRSLQDAPLSHLASFSNISNPSLKKTCFHVFLNSEWIFPWKPEGGFFYSELKYSSCDCGQCVDSGVLTSAGTTGNKVVFL